MLDPAAFDSVSPLLRDDPYPVYAELLAQAPVFWSDTERAWVLLGRKEVGEAFADPSLLSSALGRFVRGLSRVAGNDLAELLRLLDLALFFRDPPTHMPLRSMLARLLAFRSQPRCTAEVEAICQRLIVPLARDGRMDLVGEFANPLPPLFMGWLFGFSPDESLWLGKTLAGVPAVLNRGCSMREYLSANLCLKEAYAFVRAEIDRRRRQPADDGLTLLIRLNGEAEQPMDDPDLAALIGFVFMAGFETTSALIGNGLWWLLSHPVECDRLSAAPDLIPTAVEEALRLDPPIQQVRRVASLDRVVGDCTIRAGDSVVLVIAAANRDPGAYDEPDLFRPGRSGPPVISFGGGAHHCLGGWIARLEARIAFGTVLAGPRPVLEIARPEWLPNHNQRRMQRLPAHLSS